MTGVELPDAVLDRVAALILEADPTPARSSRVGLASPTAQTCADCGATPEPYLVDDCLWDATGASSSDGLCLGCLEARISRPLEPADFVWGPAAGKAAES